MHILLVEDDLDLGASLVRALQQDGFTVQWLRRAHDAPLQLDDPGCSAVLQISLTVRAGGSSVVTMEFEMNDPGHAVPAAQATSAWLAGLEEAARKARLASGATPKL